MSKVHDLVIIGAGPAGLAAAIYTTREYIDTVIFEKSVIGGLAAVTDVIDNYPGFPDGVEGLKLSDALQKQAERFGAKIEYGEVKKISKEKDFISIHTTDGNVKSKTVLIAVGSEYRKLDIPGEKEYYSRGVHYCATCDGAFYKDKKIAVVGGGNSAVQESIFLTRYVTHIDLLVRSTIKASAVLQKELQKYIDKGKITVHLNTTVNKIEGKDGMVNSLNIKKDGKDQDFKVDGLFVFIGLIPGTGFLKDVVKLDNIGLIKTDENLMTNVPGIFAAGDVRSGATLQIASASGEGATAALRIREYLEHRKITMY
jgi:thioredoxin reductase (NADPH)